MRIILGLKGTPLLLFFFFNISIRVSGRIIIIIFVICLFVVLSARRVSALAVHPWIQRLTGERVRVKGFTQGVAGAHLRLRARCQVRDHPGGLLPWLLYIYIYIYVYVYMYIYRVNLELETELEERGYINMNTFI